ncbi:sensor histidine kinase [Pacificispira sp.]|uniref:sensor histidine kinase n=1 Tax=Pacificispira sp. TaxID=2888761 RepID=UPI003BA8E7DD
MSAAPGQIGSAARSVRLAIKSVLPKRLFGRALMIIVIPLILLQVVSAWIFYDRHWDTVTWRLSVSVTGDIANVIEQLRRDPDAREEIFRAVRRNQELDLALYPGEILPNQQNELSGLLETLLAAAMEERVRRPFVIDSESRDELVIIHVQLKDAVLTTAVPRSRLFSSTTYIFILWMVGTSLVLFAVASIFMRNQVRPIRRLARAVESFGKGREPEEDFKPEGALEIRQAAGAFNLMSERIRRQVRQRTDMLSGVSHDLRTPLTRMKLQIAMLGETPETQELSANVSEMEKMIQDYLTFARGEGGEKSVECDLGQIISDLGAKWQAGGIALDCHVEGKIVSWLKPNALRRCVDNLIANASRYGTQVWLHAGRRGQAIEVLVDDNGPGIPEEEREDAFRPFYRLDRSRNPSTGGTGLGLSISRDVARTHGGDIFLEDSPHGGLRARVRLPI